ncbi:MAG: DEAD/DEAH box helicase family protein, partial [Gemmataceae bacterium]
MTPELQARQQIDRQLETCGWAVQDRKRMNITAALGVAVREFPLGDGEADYLLYADGKVIGVVEAKPEDHGTLAGVEGQSTKYVTSLPNGVPAHALPVPFHYETTGTVTQFTSLLDPAPRSRPVFAFHRPEELLRLVGLGRQLRASLAGMPPLADPKLWRVQAEAVTNLEKSLAQNRPRSLVQMATGSGKTFTAISAVYRLIKYGGSKRVLFLVDRTNLGKQTYREFQQYVSPYSGHAFTDEFNVQHLTRNALDPVCRVCITTVQRLYSMLRGDPEDAAVDDDGSMYETAASLVKEPVPVGYNPRLPVEAFDFIVADECHRSIYNLWRQVLDYFDAYLVGLTATPTKQTIGFFNTNLVMEYGHEQAVADGVNVGFDVYRIRTRITEQGATIEAEPGLFVPRRDRRTRKDRYAELDDDLTYNGSQLDRDVVSPEQIRLVVRTFRDRLLTEIFPGRTEVPKTLVFAKDDSHAEDITRIVREEFGRGN